MPLFRVADTLSVACLSCVQWLHQPASAVRDWTDSPHSGVDETDMFEDEDIGVHHTSTSATTRSTHSSHQQHRLPTAYPALSSASLSTPSLSSISIPHTTTGSSSSSAAPFTSKRRAIQFTNRSPHELEGDRIEPDLDTDSQDDEIDFTPNDSINHSTDRGTYARRSSHPQHSRWRTSRRQRSLERSPHCQSLERSVNKPFVCIYPYSLSGRRVDRPEDQQQEAGEGESGGGSNERDRCDQEFGTRQACENHIRSRHTFEKLQCTYPNCGFSSTDVQNLNKHERTHVRQVTQSLPPAAGDGGLRMKSV